MHRSLALTQLQHYVPDRFGMPVEPREWFVVPLPVINQMIERVQDESFIELVYDGRPAAYVARLLASFRRRSADIQARRRSIRDLAKLQCSLAFR